MSLRFREKIQTLLRKISLPVIFSGVLHALIFPRSGVWALSAVFLIPALSWIPVSGARQGGWVFKSFWLAGTISNIIILYWIYHVLYLNGAGIPASLAGVFLLAAYLGLYWGIFGLGVYLFRESRPGFLLVFIPALWTALEYARTYLFTGFPWLLTGYSLWSLPVLIQAASVTGVYGISFYIIFVNTSIWLSVRNRTIAPAALSALFTVILLLYGINNLYPRSEKYLKTTLLQGNISQYMKWDAEYENHILSTYRRLSLDAARSSPDMIIWPETALPGSLTGQLRLIDYVKDLAGRTGAYHIIGSFEYLRGNYYNSAYVVSPEGEISEPYRKTHLTPFGEYIPFRGLLSRFIEVINQVGDFSPGAEPVTLEIPGVRIATAICFESIFPAEARVFFRRGAGIYVNITNDGWFLDTAGPYQHFVHSVFRAVENRSYVLRAANTGISAVINPAGKVIKSSGVLEETSLTAAAGITGEKTLYSIYGDIFALITLIFAGGSVLWRLICLRNTARN